MCGIAGYSGSFHPELLGHVNRLQAHRGPDGSGQFVDAAAGIGLGHVRFAILDLSPADHMPMASPDHNV